MGCRSGLGLAITLVLSSCATEPSVSTSPPAVTVNAPVHVEEPDDGRVEIAGRLHAHDGKALRRAEVIVRRDGVLEAVATMALDGEGRFRVEVAPGVYNVTVAAVDHRAVSRTTVVSGDLRVEGRLGTYARTEPEAIVGIHGEYLDAAEKVIGSAPTSAARVADRLYRLELTAKPEGAVQLRYQLVADGGGRTYNGPLADDYASDGGGDFWSIVDVSAKETLDLDLAALPPSDQSPRLQWTGESATTAALHDFQNRWYEPLDELRRRIPRKDGNILEMTDALLAEASALAAKARAEVDATADPATNALLRAMHLSLFAMFVGTFNDAVALRKEVGWLLEHLSPSDPHLALLLNLDNAIFRARRDADEAFLARSEAWLERRAREHPAPSSAITALDVLLHAADQRGDEARVADLYALVDERFQGMFHQTYLKQRYDPERILQRGKPFPAFDFAVLGDEGRRITSTDRSGRIYMVEFWATWCGPCVAEMPKLHATYAAINGAKPGKGGREAGLRRLRPAKRPKLELVFISLDVDPAEVVAFRKEHWSMPWTHGFVGRAGEAEVMARYGFSGVPTAVLIDEAGTILEVGEALRGDALLPTLERVLAERSAAGR